MYNLGLIPNTNILYPCHEDVFLRSQSLNWGRSVLRGVLKPKEVRKMSTHKQRVPLDINYNDDTYTIKGGDTLKARFKILVNNK
jgi:hypothetical protein